MARCVLAVQMDPTQCISISVCNGQVQYQTMLCTFLIFSEAFAICCLKDLLLNSIIISYLHGESKINELLPFILLILSNSSNKIWFKYDCLCVPNGPGLFGMSLYHFYEVKMWLWYAPCMDHCTSFATIKQYFHFSLGSKILAGYLLLSSNFSSLS